MSSAIYVITNKVNGKAYVGSAVNVERRLRMHKWALENAVHVNKHLQRSWDKYGGGEFDFNVLELVEEQRSLVEREQHWIDMLKPEFNIHPNARSPLGVRRSKETKVKCSQAALRREAETGSNAKRNRSPAMREIGRKRMVLLNKSPQMRELTSRRKPFSGHTHTEEARARISEAKRKFHHCRKLLGVEPLRGQNGKFTSMVQG